MVIYGDGRGRQTAGRCNMGGGNSFQKCSEHDSDHSVPSYREAVTMMTTEDRFPPAVGDLPPGWSLATYVGPDGQDLYAVYMGGQREVAGLSSVESARRWAALLSRHRDGTVVRDIPLPLPWWS